MSLFPAYATDSSENVTGNIETGGDHPKDSSEILALEAQLLASDNDEERETSSFQVTAGATCSSHSLPDKYDYYMDCKLDYGNLRVSTLYYPGRPQYDSMPLGEAVGARWQRRGGRRRGEGGARRYHAAGAGAREAAAALAPELAQRTRAYRDMLAAAPHDERLWLRFIDFQERCGSEAAALSAAEEAAARLRAAGRGGGRARAVLYRLRGAAPPQERLRLLHADLAAAGECLHRARRRGGGAALYRLRGAAPPQERLRLLHADLAAAGECLHRARRRGGGAALYRLRGAAPPQERLRLLHADLAAAGECLHRARRRGGGAALYRLRGAAPPQERLRLLHADLAAAGECLHRARRRGGGAALYRLRGAAPPQERLRLLHADLAAAGADGALVTELWLRALAEAGAAGGAELDAAAAAALHATRARPPAYPHVLYAYGKYLRAAGLWERLVLLLELVVSMNFPPAAFPPHEDPQRLADRERHLQELEDKAISSGLPLSTVWVRVERARAAAHWRAAGAGAGSGAGADPQRLAAPADVAELLRPVGDADAAALLLVNALRLAKVPLLPCSEYALRAVDAANEALGDAGEAEGGEALLALLRAARRLPAPHPARPPAPAAAARLVAHFLDPPHYFTDDTGYLSWVTSLWDACCEWTAGERRVALLCWRLRWLHALMLLLDKQEEAGARSARRLRGTARGALKRFAGAAPLPFAHFARVELAAGDPAAARRAALHALRAALRDAACPPHHRLYVARVVCEVCDDGETGAWATACAALSLALPADTELLAPPPGDVLSRALQQCEVECDSLERQADESSVEAGGVLAAMLPSVGEWAAARARLAPAPRRAALLRRVRHAARAGAARYWEHAAAALALAAARDHRLAHEARALAPLFPHNALLALACSGAPLWAWDNESTQEERLSALTCGAQSHRGALAQLVPALLRADAADWAPAAAARLAAAAARAARPAPAAPGAALLHVIRLEAEARSTAARPERALLAALDRLPHHKWLAVRGAAWCGAQAGALSDVLLERQLRAHALLDELAPLPPNTL